MPELPHSTSPLMGQDDFLKIYIHRGARLGDKPVLIARKNEALIRPMLAKPDLYGDHREKLLSIVGDLIAPFGAEVFDSKMSIDGALHKVSHEALPGTSGYEKGYREALESMALALTGKVNAQALKEALDSALDAYANNADKQGNDCVQVDLSITDDAGDVVDGTTSSLSLEQVSSIVDQASQLVLARRSGRSIEDALAALDEALTVGDVIGPDSTTLRPPAFCLADRIALADEEFECYEFGDDVKVVSSSNWDTSDPLDLTKIVYIDDVDGGQGITDSERVSFHTRFHEDGTVSEVYGLLMRTGAEIGQRGTTPARAAEAQALADVWSTANVPRGG